MKLGTQVGGHIVLDGDPSPSQKGHSPQCSAYVYCGQTAGGIKMPLGTEVGLGPGDFVLDGDPAPSKIGAQPPPHVQPMSIVAKRLDGSRCHVVGSRSRLRRIVLDGDPASRPKKGHIPQF